MSISSNVTPVFGNIFMVSNLIYFILLIQHTAINICIIKNKYFKNIVTYYISYSDWFSAIAFGFR